MKLLSTDMEYFDRYAPETSAERDLIIGTLQLALPDDWRPIDTTTGESSGWEYQRVLRDYEFLHDISDGYVPGYLSTRRAAGVEYDPIEDLKGTSYPMQFWLVRGPSFGGEIATLQIHWRLPGNPLTAGRAQSNFLPHRPVLFTEEPNG